MCLTTTKKETKIFRKQNKDKDEIAVWKIYILDESREWKSSGWKTCTTLKSPYSFYWGDPHVPGAFVETHGVVRSDRITTVLGKETGRFRDIFWHSDQCWEINKGIHTCTTRQSAVDFLSDRDGWWDMDKMKNARIVCCHAKMNDFVAYNSAMNEAVFIKISISPRNFRRAITGK